MLQNEGTINVEIIKGRSWVRVSTNGDGKEYSHPNVRLRSVTNEHVFIGFSYFRDVRKVSQWVVHEVMTVNSRCEICLTNVLLHRVEAHANMSSKAVKPV